MLMHESNCKNASGNSRKSLVIENKKLKLTGIPGPHVVMLNGTIRALHVCYWLVYIFEVSRL